MATLRRELGLTEAVVYGVGLILGAGIYAILGEAAGVTGGSVVVSFLLAAVVASLTGLSYAELASLFPNAEGDYIYVREAFGRKVVSDLTAVGRLLMGVISSAAVALAFAGYLSRFLDVPSVLVATVSMYAVGSLLGHSLQPLSLPAVGSYLLAFLYLSAISVSIMLLTGFSTLGRVINVVLLFAVISLSNLAYPAGFFSAWGRVAARVMPTHYSMIIARGHMLKGVDTGTFSDWWGPLLGFTLVTFLVLKLSAEWYKWRA